MLEVRKRRPAPRDLTRFDAQDPTDLYITALTTGELAFAAALDPGLRRDRLGAAIMAILGEDVAERVLDRRGTPRDEAPRTRLGQLPDWDLW